MVCKFYTMKCKENVVDKTNFIEEKTEKSINLKDSTSIMMPRLLVAGTLGEFREYNYIYLPSTKRYYFIQNVTSVRQGLIEIECKCDVLYTFKDSILNGYAKITRSKTNYNKYIQDTESVKTQQNTLYQTKKFPSGFAAENYILVTTGNN